MGKHAKKTPYKKHLKEEKAKVKLKVAHKTALPKGQNVTKTDFRIKKLVLKDQIKLHGENEVLSKSNLNIQELLSRLNHHNSAFRGNALRGLTDILSNHGISRCINHLPSLLEAISRLSLDIESDVRSSAIKLLSHILSQVSEDHLIPLFEIIMKYLTCAMSHINADIRESSLDILDTLIAKNARLTAIHCESNVLPAFLDLISIKFNNSDRKLNMHYNRNTTSNIWRLKVLCRLHSLMNAIVENNVSTVTGSTYTGNSKNIKYKDGETIYASLYTNEYVSSVTFGISSVVIDNPSVSSITRIQEYVGLLIPLLLDIFIEAAPGKQTNNCGYILSPEAAILLNCITNIILLVWKIFSFSDNSTHLKHWFSKEFSNSIMENLIDNKFPYSQTETRNDSALQNQKHEQKEKKKFQTSLNEIFNGRIDAKCTEENVNLCHIYILLEKRKNLQAHNQMSNFLISTLKTCNNASKSVTEKLMACVDCLLSSDVKYRRNFHLNSVIKTMKNVYDEATCSKNEYVSYRVFQYLSRIVTDWKMVSYSKLPEIQCWLDELPKLLIKDSISFDKITAIVNIARCNITAFINSLDGYIEEILDGLPRLVVLSNNEVDKLHGKRMIANLLYFIQTWDAEFIDNLKKAINDQYFEFLTDHVKDIVRYRETARCSTAF